MFYNTVNLYKNKLLIDSQTFTVSGVYSDTPLTLEDLLDKGITFPDMPNEGNKTFLRWERTNFEAHIDIPMNVYNYTAVYIIDDMSMDYCDNHINEVTETLSTDTYSIGVNIDRAQNKLTKVDGLLDNYSQSDTELAEAISKVNAANDEVSIMLDYIENQGLPAQLSLINIKIRDTLRTLNYIGAEHESLIYALRERLNQNITRLNNVSTSLENNPKYYFMNKFDYDNITIPDASAIYFVKE